MEEELLGAALPGVDAGAHQKVAVIRPAVALLPAAVEDAGADADGEMRVHLAAAGDIDAAVPGLLHGVQHCGHRAAHPGHIGQLQQVELCPGLGGDLKDLIQGGDGLPSVLPEMDRDHPVIVLCHLGDGQQLLPGDAGGQLQREADAEGAALHEAGRQVHHGADLPGAGRGVGVFDAHRVPQHEGLGDEEALVDEEALLRDLADELSVEAADAAQRGGAALPQDALGRVGIAVHMGLKVDEARRDQIARGVDLPGAVDVLLRDADDLPLPDADVGPEVAAAHHIDHCAAGDRKVKALVAPVFLHAAVLLSRQGVPSLFRYL